MIECFADCLHEQDVCDSSKYQHLTLIAIWELSEKACFDESECHRLYLQAKQIHMIAVGEQNQCTSATIYGMNNRQ